MIGACLAFAVLVGQVPASDPTALSPSWERPATPNARRPPPPLERLGRSALPALQSVRDVKDPEIRSPGILADPEN